MKAIKYIVCFVLFFVGIFFIIPLILFRIPSFQKEISKITSKYLKEQIGTEVNIGTVEFQFFNKLTLKDVYLEDESGDTLFTAKRMDIGFDFPSLFKHQIHINFAHIYTFAFNLTRVSTDTPLNIQYIIDAFWRKKANVEISIRNFFLKDGSFSYRVKNKEFTSGKFNINDIHLKDIIATIQLYKFTDSILKVNIERLSFVEKSGVQVKQLAFDLMMNNKNIRINRLDLNLPTSHFLLKKIIANYNNLENIFTDKTHFNFQLESSQISLKDICSFVPIFSDSQSQLEIMGKFVGRLDNFKITGLTVKEGNNMNINADMKIYHLHNPFQTNICATVKNAYIIPLEIQKIADEFSLQLTNLSLLKEKLGKISFNGEISGNLNKLNTNVNINTEIGNLRADIHLDKKNNWFLSSKISAFNINMRRLTNNNDFNSASQFIINLNSTFNSHWKNWKGNIETSVKEFNYKSSYYKNIYLLGDFTSNSFKGLLKTNSLDGQITAKGFVLLKGGKSEFNFISNVSNIAFDKLYSATKYKDSKLSFIVEANLTGNHIDNFTGDIAFRKLKFSTDKNVYFIDSICINSTTDEENKKKLLLHSDIINGKIEGVYSIKNLSEVLQNFFASYLPSLATFKQSIFEKEKNDFQLDLTINNTQKLFPLLELPIPTCEQLYLNWKHNNSQNQLSLNVHSPRLNIGDYTIENGVLNLDNKKGYTEINLNGITLFKQKDNDNKLIIFANCKIQKDSICSVFRWKSNGEKQYSGRLNLVTNSELQKTNSIISVQLYPSKLIINDSVWNIAPANIVYNRESNKININHFIAKTYEQAIIIDGFIFPMKKKISILFDAHNVRMDFLHKYLDNVLSDLSGELTGKLHLFGDLNNLKIEGNALVNNGKFGIKYANTYYTFNNWIKFTPNKISIQKTALYDKYGNKAIVNAFVKYNALNHFQFTTSLSYKNLLILDIAPSVNSLFYGNVFATGTATLNGNKNFLSIETSLYNNENTNFTIDFTKTSDIADYDSIKSLKRGQDKEIKISQEKNIVNSSNLKIYLNLIANINNKANLGVIVDHALENKLSFIGNGRLQVQYNTDTPLKIFGKYMIEKGKYHFNLQQIFSRNFEIIKGSSISFKGNPFTADIDIKALHSVSTDIRDLGLKKDNRHPNIQNNIPINCVLLFFGQLRAPNIKFELELPKTYPE